MLASREALPWAAAGFGFASLGLKSCWRTQLLITTHEAGDQSNERWRWVSLIPVALALCSLLPPAAGVYSCKHTSRVACCASTIQAGQRVVLDRMKECCHGRLISSGQPRSLLVQPSKPPHSATKIHLARRCASQVGALTKFLLLLACCINMKSFSSIAGGDWPVPRSAGLHGCCCASTMQAGQRVVLDRMQECCWQAQSAWGSPDRKQGSPLSPLRAPQKSIWPEDAHLKWAPRPNPCCCWHAAST